MRPLSSCTFGASKLSCLQTGSRMRAEAAILAIHLVRSFVPLQLDSAWLGWLDSWRVRRILFTRARIVWGMHLAPPWWQSPPDQRRVKGNARRGGHGRPESKPHGLNTSNCMHVKRPSPLDCSQACLMQTSYAILRSAYAHHACKPKQNPRRLVAHGPKGLGFGAAGISETTRRHSGKSTHP